MEAWFILLVTLCLGCALKSFLNLLHITNNKTDLPLPPGPSTVPIIGNFLWLRKSLFALKPLLRKLHAKYGPVITIPTGHRPTILITDHILSHQALIQNGAIFADRPPAAAPSRIATRNQHTISSGAYGPLWRLLRRNITSQILHPSRTMSYAHARKWVLQILTNNLRGEAESGKAVQVIDHFQFAIFCLLVFMCFGEKDEKIIRQIQGVQRALLSSAVKIRILGYIPWLGKMVFRNKWKKLMDTLHNQSNIFIPLIRARQEGKKVMKQDEEFVVSYVDTLLDLQLPDGQKLKEQEIVGLCNEFLNAGTDTTFTALEWIMANLVKHQDIQAKLYSEIKQVVRTGEEISEEDLEKMAYLKAVVLEGLRRHPPLHFGLPHAVTEDFMLDGNLIQKDATVHFSAADIAWDPKVWENPMEFRPERFLSNGGEPFDITGSREIKMLPFGVGRRICPGLGLAMLHLEYFVANLIRDFEWTTVDGDDVDLSEKEEFTIMLKNPLRAHIYPRVQLSHGLMC